MHRVFLAIASAFALVLATFTTLTDASPASAHEVTSGTEVHRITGSDSISVAAKATEIYPAGQPVTFVVGASAFSDAMVAATRAGGVNAPVLLVHPSSVPAATRSALERLDTRRIVAVGGTSAISDSVASELRSFASSGTVERVEGADRYQTAVNMAKKYDAGPDRVYVAGGDGYADALAGAALAGHQRVPMLLTRQNRLDSATSAELQRLSPREIVVLGGTGVVSDSVAKQLEGYATSGNVQRVAGADRYATVAALAKQFPQTSSTMYVASGNEYADALVGAALAARTGHPLVLTRANSVPSATRIAIDHHAPSTIYALGTRQAITDSTIEALKGAPTAPTPTPPTGSALLGGYLGMPYENPDQRFRETFGDWPDLTTSYYQAKGRGGSTINRSYEQARIDRGTIPVITVTSVNGPYTMRQIGSGAADAWIDYWAAELAALDGEVWFTFDHEFEVKLNQNKWSPAPTLNDYVGAFNRFQERVKAEAPNVKFMYWYGYSDQQKINTIGSGIDRPDILALDPYVFSHHNATTTFEQMAQPKLDWLRNRNWYDGQPIVFAEFAKDTRHGDAQVASFLSDLRPRMDALGVAGAIYFARNVSSNNAIQADITQGNWPLARNALTGSVTGN